MTDPRLYDIVTNLGRSNPAGASDIFKEMLGERIVTNVQQFAQQVTTQPRENNDDS